MRYLPLFLVNFIFIFNSFSLKCEGGLDTDCTECNATGHRIMDPSGASVGSCICEDGYYDDGVNSLCSICDYRWFTLFSLFNDFSK